MKYYSDITARYLRSVLHYDAETGLFFWKERNDVPPEWNIRWAGKQAGKISPKKYIQICINYRLYLAHRLAWLYITGKWPKRQVDHRDTCKSNNRWLYLRQATNAQNNWNRSTQKNNRSGFRGVSFSKSSNRWRAIINFNGKRKNLGYFGSPEEANVSYIRAASELYGEYVRIS